MLWNSTGAPSASPTAPPSRQPVKCSSVRRLSGLSGSGGEYESGKCCSIPFLPSGFSCLVAKRTKSCRAPTYGGKLMRVRCGAICLIALFAASSDQETGAELKTRCGSSRLLLCSSRVSPASPQIISHSPSPTCKVACACRRHLAENLIKQGACELDHCGNQIPVRHRVIKRRPGAYGHNMARKFR